MDVKNDVTSPHLARIDHVLTLGFYLIPECCASKGEDRLFRKLFRRYNQFIRPVENVSDPVTVEFEVSISQLVKVVRAHIHKHTACTPQM